MKDVLVSVKIYWTKIVTFCCNLTSISIIRKCVCYCSCNGVQKCQTVEVTHHNNKQLREKKPLTIQEVLVIEQVVKWSFDFEVHTHTQYVIVRGADVHQYRMQCTLDYVLGYLINPQLSGAQGSKKIHPGGIRMGFADPGWIQKSKELSLSYFSGTQGGFF